MLFKLIEYFFFFYLAYALLKNVFAMFSGSSRQTQGGSAPQDAYRKKEGEIHVEHVPDKDRPTHEGDGEYISYTEVKE